MEPLEIGESGCGRGSLVDAVTTFLAHTHGGFRPEVRASVERAIDEAGVDAIETMSGHLVAAGREWAYFPPDPLVRRLHRDLAPYVMDPTPVVSGLEHLDEVSGRSVLIVANHLSYSDANVIEVLLARAGATLVADRLTVVAGPKVYSDVRRRFSSLCFGTIKVAQNSARSSDEAVMSPRDVARAARLSIAAAGERLALGDVILVFPEGTRSRSAGMQRFLPGVARYVALPDVWVMPMALAGTERLFPIAGEGLDAVPVTLRIGRPAAARELMAGVGGDRQSVMDAIGLAVARLLPVEYRGEYSLAVHMPPGILSLSERLFG